MSRHRRRRNDPTPDLEEYEGCPEEASLGLLPLAVGWLRRGTPFPTGGIPPQALKRLRSFCHPSLLVCQTSGARSCPLCNEPIKLSFEDGEAELGRGEIRVIGSEDIFAAPALLFHYIAVHGYQPPAAFVQALMEGGPAGSPEHRALVRVLQ